MGDLILKDLLKKYEQKRLNANINLEKRKNKLFSENPRLQEIEDDLNLSAISIAKCILSTNNENTIQELNKKIKLLKNERSEILQSLHLDISYLEPIYECPICKDTGYINSGYNTSMCNCLKQQLFNIAYNKSNIGNIEKENFSTFNINLYSDEINPTKYNSNISPKHNIQIIKNIALSFIDNFDSIDEKNLLFTGNTGLGKTFLTNCIAYEILKKGKTVLYQTSSNMLDTIIDYRFNKNNVTKKIYDSLSEVDLLIIDDLGTETINNMKLTELFNIINNRLLNQNNRITKTIISTNLSLHNILQNYDERIFSRIIGHYNACRFFGDDIRFKSKSSL